MGGVWVRGWDLGTGGGVWAWGSGLGKGVVSGYGECLGKGGGSG